MDEVYRIPSEAEFITMQAADALRPTKVSMTLKIEGGALVDGAAILVEFPEIELKEAGQMELKVHHEDNDDYDILSDDNWRIPKEVQYLSMSIDKARLVRVSDLESPAYTMRVVQQ